MPSTSWTESRARVASRPHPPVSSLFLGQATAVAPDTPGTSVLETLLSSLTLCGLLPRSVQTLWKSCRQLLSTCPASERSFHVATAQFSLVKFESNLSPTLGLYGLARDGTCLPQMGATQGGPRPRVVHPSTVGPRLLICRAPAWERDRLSRSRPILMTWALKETSSHAAFTEPKPVSSWFSFPEPDCGVFLLLTTETVLAQTPCGGCCGRLPGASR